MGHLFLGIDLGTSAVKLVLIDENKRIVASKVEQYQVASLNQGWCEIDPTLWFECMKAGMHKLFAEIDANLIEAIGVTGQMHTLVTIDQEGSPLRPAIMWNDTRTKELIPELKGRIAEFEEGAYLARTISTGSPAANLYWMSRYEKELFDRIHKFMIGPDYLVYCLSGCCGTDYCEASTSCLYLQESRQWSEEMRIFIGLHKDMYPDIRGSAVAAGKIKKELAEEFGIPDTVQIFTGTGDNPATAISAGCLDNGHPLISLGTSGVMITPVSVCKKNVKGKKILFSLDGEQMLHFVQGAVQSNGSTVDWWFRKILGKKDFSEIDAMFAEGRPFREELLFYPHLSGDKTIYADPDIRGAFLGISREESTVTMTYAVIEGLCFAMKELAEEMKLAVESFDSLKVIGGGAKSHVWMQTLANVFDMRVEQMDGITGAGYGAALLAAYGTDHELSGRANRTTQIKASFEPEKRYAALYKKKYQMYLRIHKGLNYIYEGN